jgi:hypothetical protein
MASDGDILIPGSRGERKTGRVSLRESFSKLLRIPHLYLSDYHVIKWYS